MGKTKTLQRKFRVTRAKPPENLLIQDKKTASYLDLIREENNSLHERVDQLVAILKAKGYEPDDLADDEEMETAAETATETATAAPSVPTANRFSALPEEDDNAGNIPKHASPLTSTDNIQRPTSSKTTTAPKPPRRVPKPPPVIAYITPSSAGELVRKFNNEKHISTTLKYGRESVTYTPATQEDHTKLTRELKNMELSYHTYTPRDEKTRPFVLHGLDDERITEEDISRALSDQGMTTEKVIKMKKTRAPTYLVVAQQQWTVARLNKNLRYVCYVRVQWAKYKNKRPVMQCRNCQRWGHAQRNCAALTRCVKCSEGHPSWTCPKSRETPAVCANCKGAHPASSVECPVYTELINTINKNKESAKRTYVPAPPPLVNAWERSSHAFPPLPKRGGQSQASKGQLGQSQAAAGANIMAAPVNTQSSNSFSSVFGGIDSLYAELNQLVDINTVFSELQLLLNQVRAAPPAQRQAIVMQYFLGKYIAVSLPQAS